MSNLNSNKKVKLSHNQATLHSFFVPKQSENVNNIEGVKSVNEENSVAVVPRVDQSASCSKYSEQSFELDIGCYVKNETISDDVKYNLLCKPWAPDSKYEFPIQNQSGHNRKFQIKWIQQFPWLTYSDKDKGAYCRFCVLFGRNEGGRGDQTLGALTTKPFCRYKNAISELNNHSSRNYHKMSAVKASAFKETMEGKCDSVAVQVNSHLKKIVEQNRLRLIPIVKTVLFCGRQNIPLRGHRDDGRLLDSNTETKMEGNFRALLRFRVDAGDEVLKEHMEKAPRNATLISKTTQNDLIECCGDVILDSIVKKIKLSQFYSILADETTDVSTCEQLTLCIRYLDVQSNLLQEDFVGFVNVSDLTGEALADTIVTKLHSLGLSLRDLRGQAYDGGANMAGKNRGVQACIIKLQPLALYNHCASHCLNLVISKACAIQEIRNVFGTIKDVCNFVRESAKRMAMLEAKIQNNFPETKVKRLKSLCETRWVERHDAILVFREMLPAVLEFLEEVVHKEQGTSFTLANGMVSAINQFYFIVALEIIVEIFSITLPLSRQLQDPCLDLCNAYQMAQNTIDALSDHRTLFEARFSAIYLRSVTLSEELGICVSVPRIVNRQIHRSNPPCKDPETYYRASVYVPFLDHVVSELTERFSKQHTEILALQYLIPAYGSNQASDIENIVNAAKKYEGDLPDTIDALRGEINLWNMYWNNKPGDQPKTALDSLSFAGNGYYPNIRRLLHILAILPVTTCSAERSFSSLRRVKTYLRSTMNEDRLNGLVLLHTHQDIAVSPEEVIDIFARKHRRRLELINI